MGGFRRFILWDYPRAVWQYDLMVAIIVAFIFLTPREWFRDQPRANDVVMVPSEHGSAFWIDPELLHGVSETERSTHAGTMIQARTGKRHSITRVEPIFDSEKEIRGYMAFTTP
jgi:hypothetical protein